MEAQKPIIEIRNLSKHYGGVCALNRINLNLYSGEILFIVGDNGAGKSTLINILAGVIQPDINSEILFEGNPINIKSPSDSFAKGIATIYQDLALCDNLNAYQNIFLGREVSEKGRVVMQAMKFKTHELFKSIGTNVPNPEAMVGTRSGGQRQAVAIARAMLEIPSVLLMDEATAALGVYQRKQISKLVNNLKKQNCALVIVSQDLREAAKSADRVAVLRFGEVCSILTGDEIDHATIIAHITGVYGETHETAIKTEL